MTPIVVALPKVRSYFAELIQILYDKGYFSFEADAIEYVTDLFEDIEQNLPTKIVIYKKAPLEKRTEVDFSTSIF